MKKSFLVIVLFAILMLPMNSFAGIAYIEIDDTIDLGLVSGLQFDVIGQNVEDLTLNIFRQGSSNDVDGLLKPGAVPVDLIADFPWSFETTNTNGYLAFDNSFGTFPLSSGVILSLEYTDDFTLDNFVLASSSSPDGYYQGQYGVTSAMLNSADGSIYSVSNVPLPSALLLLGTGLVGLVGIRRKTKR